MLGSIRMDLKKDFPILENNPKLVYLDSACTSLKPKQVIEAEMAYYTELGACGGRSSHRLGRETSRKTEEARENVAAFVGAKPEQLVWTRNTTEGINLVIQGFDYGGHANSGKNKVVTTVLEHHAVLLPLMQLRDKGKIKLEIVGCDGDGRIAEADLANAIDRKTALVVTNNGNNTTGDPQANQTARRITKIAHDNGAKICVDGAQGVPHCKIDFKREDFDFLCFSAHKMLGPTGIGALVAKKELLMKLQPLVFGGGTVKTVTIERADPMPDQTRFEAGIQHYSGMLGFAAACEYLKKIGMENVEAHERKLGDALASELKTVGARIYGVHDNGTADQNSQGGLCSFTLPKAKPHDVALMLDKEGIAVRSGFFCAQPAMEALGAKDGAIRASSYVYNTLDDIKKFGEAMRKIRGLY